MRILEKTMEQMPNLFTSNEFNRLAVNNGYPKRLLKNKGLSSFIKKYADNGYNGSKTWTKKKEQKSILLTEEQAIEFLKAKGYKIMKPVNDWIEC